MSGQRVERERQSYDEGSVWEVNHGWHRRFSHVFECPNTVRYEQLAVEHILERTAGARVLEIGCGFGAMPLRMQDAPPRRYLGLDVSDLAIAKARRQGLPRLFEFEVADAHEPVRGEFDLIFGESVLHHVEFRDVLPRLLRDNMAPGGRMLFVEPLSGGLLFRAYWRLAKGAHTPDERPLNAADLRWMRQLGHVHVLAFNWASLGAGIVSSLMFKTADNALTRAADWLDERVAGRLSPHLFRRAILLFERG